MRRKQSTTTNIRSILPNVNTQIADLGVKDIVYLYLAVLTLLCAGFYNQKFKSTRLKLKFAQMYGGIILPIVYCQGKGTAP